MRGFKTSSAYGIVGVFVVMGLCAFIALTMVDATDPDPKGPLALIFGVVGLYLVGLFILQRRDLNRAASGDARAGSGAPQEIDNPTTMEDGELWAAMAVKPIERDAIKARAEMWGMARSSMNLGVVITILIFLTVPPIYLLDTWITLYIGVPLIVGCALYGTFRVIGSGGDIDQGYENTDIAMRPLGLKLTARPDLKFEPRMPPMWGANARLRGPLILEGKRHGRNVTLHQEGPNSEVIVGGSVPSFKAKARDGRIRGEDDTPAAVEAVLDEIPNSTRWKGVKVHGGSAGIAVQRDKALQDWLCDLWLAERLAERL